MYIFEDSHPLGTYWNGGGAVNFGPIYLSISLSLNVILTFMIVARLFLHNRIIQNAVGPLSSPSGFTKFVNTILIESCALSGVTSLMYIGSWGTGNYRVANYIIPIFEASQVRAYRRLTAIPGCSCLISVMTRSLVHSSLFYALPIGPQ